jgi:hypothetical protein
MVKEVQTTTNKQTNKQQTNKQTNKQQKNNKQQWKQITVRMIFV